VATGGGRNGVSESDIGPRGFRHRGRLAVLARALFVWFYNRTGSSVLLVAIFHASFDASISQLSRDVLPASNTARFLIFSAVIVPAAAIVIMVSKANSDDPRQQLLPDLGDPAVDVRLVWILADLRLTRRA
jgi:hypothetical protein